MLYTTVFGFYSAFLFLRTGHLAAPVVVHCFCNSMGFPDFAEVVHKPPKERTLLLALYVCGLGLFGAYAMNAMRLEKGYPAWGADYTTERSPAETVGGRFIDMDHDFVGKEALAARMGDDDRWEMVLLELEAAALPYK